MTLVEVLAAVAVTGMIAVTVVSVLMSTMMSGKRLQSTTDGNESMRLAADLMMADARFAVRAACDWDHLTLYTSSSPSDFIMYKFATWDGSTEISDDSHLHRWVVQGGAVQRVDAVGWELAPPDFTGWDPGTEFDCNSSTTSRKAMLRMVKPPLPGQSFGTSLEVTAYLRK